VTATDTDIAVRYLVLQGNLNQQIISGAKLSKLDARQLMLMPVT
jgi:hypothetical protein